MTLRTALCDAFGTEYPVVQAPIGSATCPDLAAAVTDAGGLGMLSVTWRSPADAEDVVAATRARTDGPFGVNLVLDERTQPYDADALLDATLAAGAPVVSFSFGDAGPYVDRVHDAGAAVLVTVASAEEAREAVAAGADGLCAQGWEAGGHVQGEVATLPLVPRVADAVDVPVVAAGGIVDGRGIAAALALGADGAWLGTRFVATEEAAVADAYRERVAAADETDTEYTDLFERGWPGMPHRVLRNSTVEAWEAAGRPDPGDRLGEDEVVATTPSGEPVERYEETLAVPGTTGDVEAMALFAGQSAGLTDAVRPAADVVESLVDETKAAIDELRTLG